MTLFEHHGEEVLSKTAPLAARMRPRSFDEFVGQRHIVDPERVLRKAIEADRIPSMILWGPPGTGKTTLAFLIARQTRSAFSKVSAVTSGVADLRRIVKEAKDALGMHGRRTILFVDEIHRFNKAQQDVILPHVEDGTVVLIGATTENPSFEVISPLLSRSRVFTLNPLTDDQVEGIVRSTLEDPDRGLGADRPEMSDEALEALVRLSNGDARTALNALELAASTAVHSGERSPIDKATVEDAMQRKSLMYDKAGDQHYDTISAFIKSVRGSDPDAAVYWLGRMIEAGEDPMFVARRLVVLAAEDIGMADPQALTVAVSAQQAVHFIGMPEGRIPLAEATVYLATAPKSNSAYVAIDKAIEDARHGRNDPVPLHLRNAVTGLMKSQGYGQGYKYSHDYTDHFAPDENLPENLKGRRYYEPTDQGYEKQVSERLRRWWGNRQDAED